MIEVNPTELTLLADPNCDMCHGSGVVTEGEFDERHDAPCPCTIDEPADFSGATEGDR